MLGVIPGSFSSLRSGARLRSIGAGLSVSGAWLRCSRLHAGAISAVASTRVASRASARGMGPRSLPCSSPSTKEAAEPFTQAPARRPDGAAAAAHGAADVLAEGRPHRPVERARLARLRPDEERLAAGPPGGRRGRAPPARGALQPPPGLRRPGSGPPPPPPPPPRRSRAARPPPPP